MKFWKQILYFYLGGMAYAGLELLWRGRSHGSMFLLGGLCFLLLGTLRRLVKISLIFRLMIGAACVTEGSLGRKVYIKQDNLHNEIRLCRITGLFRDGLMGEFAENP